MPKVSFSYADKKLYYSSKTILKKFIPHIFELEGKELHQLSYIFCSDNYLLEINRQFLKHDFYTDIITFDLSESSGISGEIYISIDRVKENARSLSVSFDKELERVVFHGALHLCGYKDKKKSEIELMRNREDYFIRLYEKSLPHP